jgi:hypothetical protein
MQNQVIARELILYEYLRGQVQREFPDRLIAGVNVRFRDDRPLPGSWSFPWSGPTT